MKKRITMLFVLTLLLAVITACTTTVTVSFDSDGGTSYNSVNVEMGKTIVLPQDPVKEGFVFKGWYLDGKLFDATTPINANIVLKAMWEENLAIYNINYSIGEGANISSNAPKTFKENKGAEVKLPTPTKSGYVFLGWYENGKKVETLSENRDYNLEAQWEVAETYEIKFTVEGSLYDSVIGVENQTLAGVELPDNPTKEDYEFLGWYLNDELFDFEKEVITTDLELVAKFKQVRQVVPYAVNVPSNIVLYNTNKGDQNGDGDSKDDQNEFSVWNKSYLVGDDNNWVFKPNVTFYKFSLDANGNLDLNSGYEEVVVKKWEYEIVIYQYNYETNEYDILVDNNDTTIIESIDYENCAINFADTNDTEERAYLVKVNPTGLTKNQENNKDKFSISMKVEVVDGYNVYKIEELAYIDNRTDADGQAWDEIQAAAGLDLTINPNRVILHNNFTITDKDLPALFFYQENEVSKSDSDYSREYVVKDSEGNVVETITVNLVGSLKDHTFVFRRNMKANEKFAILGNYFKIDTSKISLVVREGDPDDATPTALGEVISHTAIFKVEGDGTTSFDIENVNFLGNANRTEKAIKGGGTMLTKVENSASKFANNISSCFFITYMYEHGTCEKIIEDCKAYDAFNSFIYNWGSKNLEIKNSEMIGAGGPVIIQDHVEPDNADGGEVASIKITDSKLESYVAGTEGWFTLVGATAVVPGIKALDALFNPFGRSYLKKNSANGEAYMNIICVNKSGNAESITAEKVKGSVSIVNEDTALDYTFNFGENNPYLAALLEQTFVNGAPAFETSAGGFSYTDGATGIFDVTNQQIVDPTNAMYKGEYLTIYFNGMMIVLGYNNAGDTYTA